MVLTIRRLAAVRDELVAEVQHNNPRASSRRLSVQDRLGV
jgi:hypothetical protein